MGFEMTLRAEREEELMEAVAFFKYFIEEMESVAEDLRKNTSIDHENDGIRGLARQHIHDALNANRIGDIEEVERNLGAAIQRLGSQEVLDLKDDKPRTDALIKISRYMTKANDRMKQLKYLIQKNKELI